MTTLRLPRRVTVLEDRSDSPAESGQLLAEHRDQPAYVLLGEPGSGKTTAFQMEHDADRGNSELVSVRDFTRLDLDSHPEWRGKTLFIDVLDEMRTGSGDWWQPLDEARKRLEQLENPRFRLSCRAGEWLGDDDSAALERLVPDGEFVILRLDPLNEEEVRAILVKQVGEARVSGLMQRASEYGLHGFFEQPLQIQLLLEAGIGGQPFTGRRSLFESACRAMVTEKNPRHRVAARGSFRPTEAVLLNLSGQLCALSLLTDTTGWSVTTAKPTPDYPWLSEVEYEHLNQLDYAVRTRLFRVVGQDGRFEPIHRQVAEYLAGRFLGRQVEEQGLSPARVRALMASDDGVCAPSLRGLAAWIAVHSPTARPTLIGDDPIGVASYGDPTAFAREEQRRLVSSLRDRAGDIDVWKWPSFALPSLATPGALPIVRDIIRGAERDDATQGLALLALLAVAQPRGFH